MKPIQATSHGFIKNLRFLARGHALRFKFALVFLAVSAAALLFSAGNLFLAAGKLNQEAHQSSNDVSRWIVRLELLIPLLPKTGVIGYVSERDIPGVPYNDGDQTEEMAMSQFALAPRILKEGFDQDWVVANIVNLKPEQIPAVVAPYGMKVEKGFDFGIYLLKRERP